MENLNELFVPQEIAIEMKENGFDEKCFMFWFQDRLEDDPIFKQYDTVNAPTYEQAKRWFRTTCKIFIGVQLSDNSFTQNYRGYTINKLNPNNTVHYNFYATFQSAENEAIKEALKLI